MAVTQYSAIPDPSDDPASLREAVVALKENLEVLIGLRGTGTHAIVSQADLVAQQNLAGVDPAVALSNLGISSLSGDLATLTATVTALTATVTALSGTVTSHDATLTTLTSAWSTFTPTISASAGTITTKTGTGRYKQIGKIVFFEIVITITTNGTGSGTLNATLPVAPQTYVSGCGREHSITGKMVNGWCTTGSTLLMTYYDNTYPGVNGGTYSIGGSYEAA